jgi:serine phosphatase RsbU (regulator of sigma subunit)
VHASQILNELRSQVIHSLHQTGKEGENQDGMDVAIFILDKEKMEIEFAGANNPLLIYRDKELIEVKGDKMPIGIHRLAENSFSNSLIKIQKDDMIYTFSDGYPDQFGGPDGKKLMIKNFKNILKDISDKSMSKQKSILEEKLSEWMGDYHQIDDILVMGVRI